MQCGKEDNFQVTSFVNLPTHLQVFESLLTLLVRYLMVGVGSQHFISPLEAGLEKFLDALRFQEAHFNNVLDRATSGKRKAEEECAHLHRYAANKSVSPFERAE